jgi:hypothetical protein
MAIATVQGQLDAAAAPFTEPAPQFGAVTVDAAKAQMWTYLRSATTTKLLR